MTNSTYTATLHRPRDIWRDWTIACKGIEVVYRPSDVNGLNKLAHDLRERGNPDGDISVVEIKTNNGLVQRLPSIYTLADLYDQTPQKVAPEHSEEVVTKVADIGISDYAYNALKELRADGKSWSKFGARSKGLMVDRGFAIARDKNFATITEAGIDAISKFDTVKETTPIKMTIEKTLAEPETISLVWFNALKAVGNDKAWNDVHGQTKNGLIRRGLVEMKDGHPVRTDIGTKMMKEFVK